MVFLPSSHLEQLSKKQHDFIFTLFTLFVAAGERRTVLVTSCSLAVEVTSPSREVNMSDKRRLIYSFVEFLTREMAAEDHSEDAKESLEVASQCLQVRMTLKTALHDSLDHDIVSFADRIRPVLRGQAPGRVKEHRGHLCRGDQERAGIDQC